MFENAQGTGPGAPVVAGQRHPARPLERQTRKAEGLERADHGGGWGGRLGWSAWRSEALRTQPVSPVASVGFCPCAPCLPLFPSADRWLTRAAGSVRLPSGVSSPVPEGGASVRRGWPMSHPVQSPYEATVPSCPVDHEGRAPPPFRAVFPPHRSSPAGASGVSAQHVFLGMCGGRGLLQRRHLVASRGGL